MTTDLHTHSRYSDGSSTLEELFIEAKKAGITQLGVVDHDTIKHHAEGRRLAVQYGIDFVAGIEISAFDYKRNRKVHLLGYGFTGDCANMEELCRPLLARRHAHSIWQLERIKEVGFQLDLERALHYAETCGTLYKQHIMHALTDAPYNSKSYQTIYRSLFKNNGVASGDIRYVDAFDAMHAIHADGGIAVLAHPGQLQSFEIAEELIANGLDGIEVIHPDHSMEDIDLANKLAEKYRLIKTGGSDYHAQYGNSVKLGQYTCQPLQTAELLSKR
ncbi:PHP domain-containing protein [Solibacillus sp. MA9]|uniref:PHP domain-containing protein n=1 Tax=Solibacillus palustris TaxID=2908203 RepID=A0ABS9UDV4_9BACL|nr:PHP domain-containing protein [Solibacillus sp. MA9]MCH7322526.1 PHP domain-containing protein [Solibacillus sp. MA9]